MDPRAASFGPSASMERWRRLPVAIRRALVTARRLSHASRRPHAKVGVDVFGSVTVVTIDDGKVNALSRPMTRGASTALDRVEADDRVRALVITGRPGYFCAGFDLDTLMIGGRGRNELVREGFGLMLRMVAMPLPVVVACTGHAVGAGAGLLLTGDVRLGAEGDFKIGFYETAIGLPTPGFALTLAAARLSARAYQEAMHEARMYRPWGALAAGFFDRVVAPAELIDTAIGEADRLARDSTFHAEKEAQIGPVAERMREQFPADLRLIERFGA